MITLAEAKTLATECDRYLRGNILVSVEAVGEKRWVLRFERSRFFVCLHKPFCRFHLSSVLPKSAPRQWDSMACKRLQGGRLEQCHLLAGDRIVELVFSQSDVLFYLIFELFSGQAHLLDAKRQYLASYPSAKQGEYTLPPSLFEPPELAAACSSEEIEARYAEKEKEAQITERKELLARALAKMIKQKQGLIAGAQAEAMLAKREEELESLQAAVKELSPLTTHEMLDAFAARHHLLPPPLAQKKKSEPKKRLPYRTFTTEKGMAILAGKSDKEGEILTFQVAHGSDYWLHVANYPGSHVVLQCPRGEEPDGESLLDACQIALHFSKAKKSPAEEVTVTQVKHVSKPRGGKPGLVTVSRHKKKYCKKDQKRLDRLLASGEKIP